MAKDKKEYVTLITPKGVAVWPHLNSLDEYEGSLTWHTRLAYDPNAPKVAEFLADLEQRAEAAFEEAKADQKFAKIRKELRLVSPVKDEVDEEGNETGRKIIRVKRLGKVSDKSNPKEKKDNSPPKFFDVKGMPLTGARIPRLGAGSEIKAEVGPSNYCMAATKQAGITLYLNSVQIIKLVEFGGGGRSPFGDEGEGFTGAAAEPQGFGDESGDEESVNGSDF
jgi:hypothetical protein